MRSFDRALKEEILPKSQKGVDPNGPVSSDPPMCCKLRADHEALLPTQDGQSSDSVPEVIRCAFV